MNYQQTLEYLYNATPQFQQIGAAAYKPGLDTARTLDRAFGSPHRNYRIIHVAGTNGKGSTCHTLAAILQAAGYRVGLYTSPHLVDFRERIRVNGEMISHEAVVDFVERYRGLNCNVEPSFFELTTIMAFEWFAKSKVDFAVIETGLGGRLDTTNIVSPILSVITNISFDHKAQLGNTLELIAREKAGIIKPGVPVVIGNDATDSVRAVFDEKARNESSPIIRAYWPRQFTSARLVDDKFVYTDTIAGTITGELSGECQPENAATVLAAIKELQNQGVQIPGDAIREGFANVVESTGLRGRWMKVSDNPPTVCDTGHNIGGWELLGPTIARMCNTPKVVLGFVSDKDVDEILCCLPLYAKFYFTQASVRRAMPAKALSTKAHAMGFKGRCYKSVATAYKAAIRDAIADGSSVFVGGSTFIVADLLSYLNL